MTPAKRDGMLVRLARWIEVPANRRGVMTIAGILIGFLGGAGVNDVTSKTPVTREDLDTAKAEIMAIAAQAVDGYANRNDDAFAEYRDSLQVKEQWYREHVAVPMLASIEDLSQRVARIEKLSNITVKKLDENGEQQRSTLDRIDAQVDDLQRNGHYDGEMSEILRLLRDQAREIDAIKEQLPVRRTTKPKLP